MGGGRDPHILILALDGVERSAYCLNSYNRWVRRWICFIGCVFEEEKHRVPVSGIQLQLLLQIKSVEQNVFSETNTFLSIQEIFFI